ncbi:hypothetical protein RF11_12622 [Thelohanellus kitauei]|uniref:ISXO2-like transposase domain-containing protein n=1 Tax=Thelohanellus kitauei TaxID=669202 RepID=A0A0C2MBX2_THEKT|nr:hypothetical protein RF11_12622 [Thelohanellus kitauei]
MATSEIEEEKCGGAGGTKIKLPVMGCTNKSVRVDDRNGENYDQMGGFLQYIIEYVDNDRYFPDQLKFLIELRETLINVTRRYVLPGSKIITDCFRSYSQLSSYYERFIVNHSQWFINRPNGACTNTIEGTWRALKMKISPRNRTNSFNEDEELEENTIDQFLGEFLLRRKNIGNL